jgi:hypothetical protein
MLVANCVQIRVTQQHYLRGRHIPAQGARKAAVMRATRCSIIIFSAVLLASCAWQPARLDHAQALSEMADKAANDSAKCQASGAALGSQAYKQCLGLLEDKMSIDDVPLNPDYAQQRP